MLLFIYLGFKLSQQRIGWLPKVVIITAWISFFKNRSALFLRQEMLFEGFWLNISAFTYYIVERVKQKQKWRIRGYLYYLRAIQINLKVKFFFFDNWTKVKLKIIVIFNKLKHIYIVCFLTFSCQCVFIFHGKKIIFIVDKTLYMSHAIH